jgi:chemotaxis protein MotB
VRRRAGRDAPGHRERWLISYADFITLLFAFFTTLYAISVVDAVKAKKLVHSIRESFGEGVLEFGQPSLLDAEPGSFVQLGEEGRTLVTKGRDEALTHVAASIDRLPLPKGMGDGVTVRQTERGLVITLVDALFFETGGTELPDAGREALRQIAAVLRYLPNHIRVEGHTDNRPIAGGPLSTNWHLSAMRAVEILVELEKGGINRHQLSASGFGDQRPLVSNRTEEGQRLNRRVDIVVVRAKAPPGAQ